MNDRETVLGELGIDLVQSAPAAQFGSVTSQDIPSLSGYSEFTPIRIVSSDVKVPDADLERNQQRD